MRFLRSITFGLIGLAVMALCAAMPAAASVPIDPGIHVMMPGKADHPAPTSATVCHVALTCEAPATGMSLADARSPHANRDIHFINIDGSSASFLGLRRRC